MGYLLSIFSSQYLYIKHTNNEMLKLLVSYINALIKRSLVLRTIFLPKIGINDEIIHTFIYIYIIHLNYIQKYGEIYKITFENYFHVNL